MTPPQTVRLAFNDAAALVRVCAPLDFAEGLTAIPESLGGRLKACCVGPGSGLAAEYGRRHGVAFLFDPRHWQQFSGTQLVVAVTRTTCHEAGHLITTPDVSPAGVADAVARAAEHYCPDAAAVARGHCPRWAACHALLVQRGCEYRREAAPQLLKDAAADLARYGYQLDQLLKLVDGFTEQAPLRQLLEPGSPHADFLVDRLPGLDARVAAVAASGILPAATGAA